MELRELRASQPIEASVCLFVVFVGSDNRHAEALEACVRKHPGNFPGWSHWHKFVKTELWSVTGRFPWNGKRDNV